MPSNQPAFDIILVGATGFTGQLVAQQLTSADTDLRWAIAGRNREKLEAVQSRFAPNAAICVVDSNNADDMQALAESTRVVMSTAGPFAKIGTQLVAACAKVGVDYVDITGETQWIRETIDAFHPIAQASGARLIHCCGFDSIPSDLGVSMLLDTLRPSETNVEIHGVFTRIKGGLSGGTYASMQNVMVSASEREVARVLRHPFSLNPNPLPKLREPADQMEARFIPELNFWTAPFVMAAINTRVVRRSEALRGMEPEALHYHESVRSRSKSKAAMTTALLGAGMALQTSKFGRLVSGWCLPKPGQGPSSEAQANGGFELKLFGRQAGAPQYTHCVKVSAQSDPGYSATAKMITQAALTCLETASQIGGVLTPSVALGKTLIERLNTVGVSFEHVEMETS